MTISCTPFLDVLPDSTRLRYRVGKDSLHWDVPVTLRLTEITVSVHLTSSTDDSGDKVPKYPFFFLLFSVQTD